MLVVSVISLAFGSDFKLKQGIILYIAHYSLCFEITLKCIGIALTDRFTCVRLKPYSCIKCTTYSRVSISNQKRIAIAKGRLQRNV